MKTEQIMALLADLRSRINPAYAAQFGTESYERRLCAEAIEQLVHERDALAAENKRISELADKWNLECDELREDNKRLAAENKVLRNGMQVYQSQLEKDTVESDLHALMQQGVEIAELKAENKALRDALEYVLETCDWHGEDGREAVSKARAALKGEVK